jgi:hypothetical protein
LNTKIWIAICSLLGLLCFSSCSEEKREPKVDLSQVVVPFKAHAFYKDFAALDTIDFGSSLARLKQKYPYFTDFFLDTLLPFTPVNGNYSDAEATAAIRNIFTYKDYVQLTDTVLRVFPDTKKYDAAIEEMLRYTKYYCPTWELPSQTIYFVSCLNRWTAFTKDSILGIGLDLFLGPQFRPYEAIALPQYALINNTAENIPLWAAKAIYQDKFEEDRNRKDMITLMIKQGKEILFLSKVMPDFKFNLIMGYTEEQLKWCESNEALIFNLFLQQNLLYSKDYQATMRYLSPGTNSAGFPDEAPGNLGTFIGYKILKAYEKQTGKALADFLAQEDGNAVFQASKYKP